MRHLFFIQTFLNISLKTIHLNRPLRTMEYIKKMCGEFAVTDEEST